jgi:plastocyanin
MRRSDRIRSCLALVAVAALLAAGCSRDDSAATVLVDYDHDEFATQFVGYFPDRVQAHPGDTITFKQYWTGEPHTVTFTPEVQDVLDVTRPLLEEYGHLPEHEVPEEVFAAYFEAEGALPSVHGGPPGEGEDGPPGEGEDGPPGEGEDGPPGEGEGGDDGEGPGGEGGAGGEGPGGEGPEDGAAEGADGEEGASEDLAVRAAEADDAAPVVMFADMPQGVAQPCVIEEGGPPEGDEPCEERELPPFDGTQAFYNSGIIPYEGPGGNVFTLELADDIEPGEYPFYCAVHGSWHSGVLEVLPEDEPLPSPQENSRELQVEIHRMLEPYATTFTGALHGNYVYRGRQHEWNYAGLLTEDADVEGIINEFVPRDITTRVDEPVNWRIFGPHSISFDVPEYFPIVEFLDDGTVRSNEALFPPAGGAPEPPEPEDPTEPLVIDGGTYDGSGFWSSGVLWSDEYVDYTLRFSEPGEYPFACLIHPPMVGTVRVTE